MSISSPGFVFSTTGTLDPVAFDDLGSRDFAHPTTDYDLTTEFKFEEIISSPSMVSLLDAGHITVKAADGTVITSSSSLGRIEGVLTAPVDGDTVTYNATLNEWVPRTNAAQPNVIDQDLTAPPGSPAPGDRYIVNAPATGDWAGHEGDIAEWNGSEWVFTPPEESVTIYVDDEGLFYQWDGTEWVASATDADVTQLQSDVEDRSTSIAHLMFTEEAHPYKTNNSNSYAGQGQFIYGGSDNDKTITQIRVVLSKAPGGGSIDCQVVDLTNGGAVLGSVTGVTVTVPTIFNLGTILNVPTGEALMEVQTRRSGGTTAQLHVVKVD